MDNAQQLEVIRSSTHLHKAWYRASYLGEGDTDPAEHYLTVGAAKGFNPGKFFDTAFYVETYPDVAESGLNPLVHYELYGRQEDRIYNPAKAASLERRRAAQEAAAARAARRAPNNGNAEADRSEATRQPPTAPEPALSAVDRLAAEAREAARRGNWAEAARGWQMVLSLPAEPYVGLSEALFAQGDIGRAEAVIRQGLEQLPDNPLLLMRYCQIAIDAKRWAEVPARWQMVESRHCPADAKLRGEVAEALIRTGHVDRAELIVRDALAAEPGNLHLLKAEARVAEARGNWRLAADLWQRRGRMARGVAQANSNVFAVRALLRLGDTDGAEALCAALVSENPGESRYLRLRAELAILQDAWAVALDRWMQVEEVEADEAGAMPPSWVFRIGIENARTRTAAIRIARLRSRGFMTLARTLRAVDEVAALRMARRARTHYPDQMRALVAEILSDSTRHSAAIWWLRRLVASSAQPARHYPLLVDALIESSRLDEAQALAEECAARFGRDTLWLRAMTEILYRRGDFPALRQLLLSATSDRLPDADGSVRVTRWLYDLIRLHPDPQSFLPAEIHDLAARTATIYDGKFMAQALTTLLNPAAGDIQAETWLRDIAAATEAGRDLDVVSKDEMLQFFLRRRDWDTVHGILSLPLMDSFDAEAPGKTWNVVRTRVDLLLGEGAVAEAEALSASFIDLLDREGRHDFTVTEATRLLFRFPLSAGIADRIGAAAGKLGFVDLRDRMIAWRRRFGGMAPALPTAGRARCFILGNAPSVGRMPLHLLEGEDIFVVNRGMRARDFGLPQPKYLVVADPLVYKNHLAEIDADGRTVEGFFVA
ncbi:MAG: tetratricopeptide repeat protein, partial [Gemmobacter sp.]